MWVVKYRKVFYIFSALLIAASIVSLFIWHLKLGMDFTGGSLIEVQYPQTEASTSTPATHTRPEQAKISEALASIDQGASVRPSGDDNYIVRMKAVSSQEEKDTVIAALSLGGTLYPAVKTFDSIGPVLGDEARTKSLLSILVVILGIVLYITFAFRKVSEPVQSWKYGLVAIVALLHDVIIPVGVFSILGHFLGYEVDTLFATALLVILGFSVHDTIVVFDRVRENLGHAHGSKKPFEQIVGESVGQTFTRSINTSLTTLIALAVLYFLGGPTTQHFSLALIIGIAVGTYSSVFIGSPLLVTIQNWGRGPKSSKK